MTPACMLLEKGQATGINEEDTAKQERGLIQTADVPSPGPTFYPVILLLILPATQEAGTAEGLS